MSNKSERKFILSFCAVFAVMLLISALPAIGQTTTKTLKLSGTVVSVEGNTLIVKMSNGDVRVFTPPPDRKFIIDGKELTLSDLVPGTHLNATVTETTTSVVDRTIDTLQGQVLYAAGPTVVLKLASGETKKYYVKHDMPVKFMNEYGKEITVFDLRKGMNITATKITEAPRDEIATNTDVTGTAPKAGGSQMAEPTEQPSEPAAPSEPASAPAPKMPKTGSPLPLIGQLGLLCIAMAFGIRRFLL
jgi:hypothetical protein